MTTAIRDDFRSDTVTRAERWYARGDGLAEVGDDVFGDDLTVRKLEGAVAERPGKAARCSWRRGPNPTLAALMAHCGRGDEYIAAWMPMAMPTNRGRGVARKIQRNPSCISRTARWRRRYRSGDQGGRSAPRPEPACWPSRTRSAVGRCRRAGSRCDGARLAGIGRVRISTALCVFNAAVAGNLDVGQIAAPS